MTHRTTVLVNVFGPERARGTPGRDHTWPYLGLTQCGTPGRPERAFPEYLYYYHLAQQRGLLCDHRPTTAARTNLREHIYETHCQPRCRIEVSECLSERDIHSQSMQLIRFVDFQLLRTPQCPHCLSSRPIKFRTIIHLRSEGTPFPPRDIV